VVACEAKDGKRQRQPVSVAARLSSTPDHDSPPRPSARYAMHLPNTLNDRLRTSTAQLSCMRSIRTAVALRTEAEAGRPRSVGPASLAVLPPMDELASPGR
jgi:hypothetical protein